MSQKSPVYFLINKPYGVLSQFSDEDNNPGLGSIFSLPSDVYPVGRLDLDSEGLLILTNDKKLNHLLLNPKHEHLRTYHVEVENVPNEHTLSALRNGVEINLKGRIHKSKKCSVEPLKDYVMEERNPAVNRIKHPVTSWIGVSLTEGKNRQVRRMTAKVGHPTLRLIRVSIENLALGNIPSGGIVQISKRVIYEKLKLGHSM